MKNIKTIVSMAVFALSCGTFAQEYASSSGDLERVLEAVQRLDVRFASLENDVRDMQRAVTQSGETTAPTVTSTAVARRQLQLPVDIMGTGFLSANDMAIFLLHYNPNEENAFQIAVYYIEEAAAEGVNHDVAFAQMCLETGYLKFGGRVKRSDRNFGGLGAFAGNTPATFSSDRYGVRAHIQHLKAYASTESLQKELIDPRYTVLIQNGYIGTAPTVYDLTGKWATDPNYADKIMAMIARFYQFLDENHINVY
ncbi:MAG: hypothetical protein Ta2A_02700 [Treponemataceae bacterium]|nr:MAG: hypothetical protein Ta2A_02700 [Treponemataceae bacterium]